VVHYGAPTRQLQNVRKTRKNSVSCERLRSTVMKQQNKGEKQSMRQFDFSFNLTQPHLPREAYCQTGALQAFEMKGSDLSVPSTINEIFMDLDQIATKVQLVIPSLRYRIGERYCCEIKCDSIRSIHAATNIASDERTENSDSLEQHAPVQTVTPTAGVHVEDSLEQWLDDILQ
ncbi:unnamed protein product, partial [Albugo candida]